MMRASVKSDETTRVIELVLEADGAAWDLHDVTATWRKVPRIFRPDRARLVLDRDKVLSINVAGHLVLKSGAVSDNHQSRDSMTWAAGGYHRGKLADAPEWVQEIVRQAPLGITSYVWTDSERAEEVQAL
jgi:hypothetical protein